MKCSTVAVVANTGGYDLSSKCASQCLKNEKWNVIGTMVTSVTWLLQSYCHTSALHVAIGFSQQSPQH